MKKSILLFPVLVFCASIFPQTTNAQTIWSFFERLLDTSTYKVEYQTKLERFPDDYYSSSQWYNSYFWGPQAQYVNDRDYFFSAPNYLTDPLSGIPQVNLPSTNGDQYFITLKTEESSGKYKYLQTFLNETTQASSIVTLADRAFILPKDIIVTVKECKNDVEYLLKENEIEICYQWLDRVVKYDVRQISTGTKIKYAFDWIFLHKLGHTLIDIYDLNLPTQDERVVNEFVVYFLYRFGNAESINGAIVAMFQFYKMAQENQQNGLDFSLYSGGHTMDVTAYSEQLKFMLGLFSKQMTSYIGGNAWQMPQRTVNAMLDISAKRVKIWDGLMSKHIRDLN